jgi:glycine/D-amino acid oxidase-like deaminating enzyme
VNISADRLISSSAGVIGLSSALLLQQARYAVTIVARDFPGPFETMDPIAKINYTSPWGGARMPSLAALPIPRPDLTH